MAPHVWIISKIDIMKKSPPWDLNFGQNTNTLDMATDIHTYFINVTMNTMDYIYKM